MVVLPSRERVHRTNKKKVVQMRDVNKHANQDSKLVEWVINTQSLLFEQAAAFD